MDVINLNDCIVSIPKLLKNATVLSNTPGGPEENKDFLESQYEIMYLYIY
jgi:hypothetical protein